MKTLFITAMLFTALNMTAQQTGFDNNLSPGTQPTINNTLTVTTTTGTIKIGVHCREEYGMDTVISGTASDGKHYEIATHYNYNFETKGWDKYVQVRQINKLPCK